MRQKMKLELARKSLDAGKAHIMNSKCDAHKEMLEVRQPFASLGETLLIYSFPKGLECILSAEQDYSSSSPYSDVSTPMSI